MNSKLLKFKQELNRVFDDNLHTKQWHNYVDYAIIGFIVLSTIEVFLSTYDGIVEKNYKSSKLKGRKITSYPLIGKHRTHLLYQSAIG